MFLFTCFVAVMTSTEGNDLMPAQEKLEWVTPKISLMDAGDTDGSKNHEYKFEDHKRGPS